MGCHEKAPVVVHAAVWLLSMVLHGRHAGALCSGCGASTDIVRQLAALLAALIGRVLTSDSHHRQLLSIFRDL